MAKQSFEDTQILPEEFSVSPAPSNLREEGLPQDQNLVSGLPPNTGGNSIQNAIDVATLGRFTPDGQGGGASSDDLSFVKRQIDPLSGEPVALADATNELFMPGLNKPIRVGGTSGQLTGSRDIFVAQGGITPFAALERKKAAQQEAALEKQKKLSQFKVKLPKLSKDPRFNDNILKASSKHDEEFIARAKQQFGNGWQVALTSPETKIGREFIQGKANLDLLAGKIDQIVDLQSDVEKAIEKGDQYVSDATLQLHDNFKRLSNEFTQEGGNLGAADLGGILDKLQTSQTLDQFIKENDILKNIDGEILQRAGIDDSRADQFRQTTRYTEDFAKGVATQAKRVKGNAAFRNRQDLQESDIAQILGNLKGKVDKRTASVKSKPASEGFSSKDEVPVSNQPKIINVGQSQFQTKMSVPFSKKAQSKPVRVDGLITVGEDGNLTTQTGITDFIPVENSVIDVNGIDRRVVRGKVVKEKKNPVSGKVEKTFEDATVDFDNIKSSLGGLSKDSNFSVEAFDDVSQSSKRNTSLIDANTFDSEFKEAFVQSGFTDVNDFIKAAADSGIDVIFNEESRGRLDELRDPLNQ